MTRKQGSSWLAWVVTAVVLVAVVAGGVVLWQRARQAGQAEPAAAATAPPAPVSAPVAASTAPRHPIGAAGPAPASTVPLPPLDQSDADVGTALLALAGGQDLESVLLRRQLVRHIVATVDALPRQSVGEQVLPLRTPTGAFEVDPGTGGSATISARNAARYAPYMRIVEAADPHALVGWYVRYYPLFEQAYRDLGYPQGHFNDRLVAAIDDMLAAPEPQGPVAVVRPKVLYQFADPALQARSVGQRLMLRIGPADEAKVKAKLRAIRDELTGGSVPAAAASR